MIKIDRKPDMSIEPGHQVLLLPSSAEGAALSRLLTGEFSVAHLLELDGKFHVPHTAVVDRNIVDLIDALAHVRNSQELCK
jgi:hypothetical protein